MRFRFPRDSVGDLDAEMAATLIAAMSDIALVVDTDGVIRDLAFGSDDWSVEWYGKWLGLPWVDTVTGETRQKIEALVEEATTTAPSRWRQVNHPSSWGADVPVIYCTMRLRPEGPIIACGRDLRSSAALQQRLIEAQQSMERHYSRLRNLETRYRLLFQMSAEAVLIVDAVSRKVIEANPAAGPLFGEASRRVVGRVFPDGFDADSTTALQSLLAAVRATGRAEEVRARLADTRREFVVSASLFRQENAALFLVRLVPGEAATVAGNGAQKGRTRLADLVETSPDAIVLADPQGRVTSANPAFLDLVQLATDEQVKGESLERWLGRPGVDFNVLMANLRQHGSVRRFSTLMRGEYGATADVELSATAILNGKEPAFGFTIRNVGDRMASESHAGVRELPRSVEQLTELVGRVPLKDLVRETTDVIERLCIEAALELTGDNRASAAELLGLSRQSLYVKLRRYGLGDLGSDGAEG
jgi:transcriptional regulator PpsR